MFEPLEVRRLYAASLSQGILTLRGTSASSQISVAIVNRKIVATINGAAQRFTVGSILSISVLTYSGNDTINLSGIGIATVVSSDDGNDTISGSSSADKISGGAGNDRIYGNGGDDR